jgi:hypothetical protein
VSRTRLAAHLSEVIGARSPAPPLTGQDSHVKSPARRGQAEGRALKGRSIGLLVHIPFQFRSDAIERQ